MAPGVQEMISEAHREIEIVMTSEAHREIEIVMTSEAHQEIEIGMTSEVLQEIVISETEAHLEMIEDQGMTVDLHLEIEMTGGVEGLMTGQEQEEIAGDLAREMDPEIVGEIGEMIEVPEMIGGEEIVVPHEMDQWEGMEVAGETGIGMSPGGEGIERMVDPGGEGHLPLRGMTEEVALIVMTDEDHLEMTVIGEAHHEMILEGQDLIEREELGGEVRYKWIIRFKRG